MVVYAVNKRIDLGIQTLGVFVSEEVAKKVAKEKNDKLDKEYWDGYSDDIYGFKKVFVEPWIVQNE
jgi:hypothetical protein